MHVRPSLSLSLFPGAEVVAFGGKKGRRKKQKSIAEHGIA